MKNLTKGQLQKDIRQYIRNYFDLEATKDAKDNIIIMMGFMSDMHNDTGEQADYSEIDGKKSYRLVIDDVGYSKTDMDFMMSLSEQAFRKIENGADLADALTDRQFKCASRIVKKYWKQILMHSDLEDAFPEVYDYIKDIDVKHKILDENDNYIYPEKRLTGCDVERLNQLVLDASGTQLKTALKRREKAKGENV